MRIRQRSEPSAGLRPSSSPRCVGHQEGAVHQRQRRADRPGLGPPVPLAGGSIERIHPTLGPRAGGVDGIAGHEHASRRRGPIAGWTTGPRRSPDPPRRPSGPPRRRTAGRPVSSTRPVSRAAGLRRPDLCRRVARHRSRSGACPRRRRDIRRSAALTPPRSRTRLNAPATSPYLRTADEAWRRSRSASCARTWARRSPCAAGSSRPGRAGRSRSWSCGMVRVRCKASCPRRKCREAAWAAFGALTQETSVALTGMVREEPRSPGGYELAVTGLELLGPQPRLSRSPPKSMGRLSSSSIDTCGSAPAGRWRSPGCATRWSRRSATTSTRKASPWWTRPILTGAIGEEAGNLFATDYFDLGKAYLAQTGQLYVEAAAAALGKVYCFGPTFRAEKSKTRRHLTEFWMVEPEVAFNDSDANMRLQESFVSYIVARALERRRGRAQGAGARHRPARAGAARPSRGSPTPTRSRGSTSSAPTSRGAPTSAATTRRCWPRSTTGRSSSSTTPSR